MEEFSAKEILRQSSRIKEQSEAFYETCNTMIKELNDMALIVWETDSNLRESLHMYRQSFINLHANLDEKFKELAKVMDNWANKTIENETTASENVSNASDVIDNINRG